MIVIDLTISECPKFSKSERRFKSYDYKRKGGMSAVTRFAYAILLAKMGQKLPKNSHFGPKNDQNHLKFGQTL